MAVRLLVLAGPTASGKTRLGVRAAHALGTEIVSADSRQVYRGLDVGSGKDLEEYRAVSPPVPCRLIDVADPAAIYSVFHYQRDCYRLLAEWEGGRGAGGTPLLMVGGTGLFVEAVLKGYRISDVPEDEELRTRLMARPASDLIRELRSLDEDLHRRTDTSSKKRVVRAVEIARHAQDHDVAVSPPPPVRIEHAVFALDVPREELHRRIDARLDSRLAGGMIEEVRGLLDRGLPPARMAQLGLEYREVTAFLTGAKSRSEMEEDLRLGIRHLAKRQLTWFRGFPRRGIEVRWIGPEDVDAVLGYDWKS